MLEFKGTETKGLADKDGFSVRVFGIGGAGANALDRIALEGMDGADLIAMNTDIRALSTSVANTKVQLGKELTRGLGAGGDPELGREAAVEAADGIRDSVKDQTIVFVCVGLGGGTGSGAAPVIARLAEQAGAFVVVFATFPFSFEGRRRLEQAQSALNELAACSNAVIVFENDRMGELILAKEGIQKAFAAADKIISQSVRAVTQLVTKSGLIHIGLDDLISALRNNNSRCLFGYGRAKGSNRAQAAVKEALKSPLLDRGQLAQAKNVLVHICGGDTLTLYEVELLMEEVGKVLDTDAQIFFGTGTDPNMGDEVGVTVISSVGGGVPVPAATETTAAEPAPAEEAAPVVKPAKKAKAAREPEPVEEPEEEPVTAEAEEASTDRNGSGDDEPVLTADDVEDEVIDAPVDGDEEAAPVPAGKRSTAQAELKLNPGARGRFEKAEPTIIDGEDLDVPTFLRDQD